MKSRPDSGAPNTPLPLLTKLEHFLIGGPGVPEIGVFKIGSTGGSLNP